MNRVALFLLAVVITSGAPGCDSGDHEKEFNMNGTWRVTQTVVSDNCGVTKSQFTSEWKVFQKGAYLRFGEFPGHFDTATGAFSAKGWAGSIGIWGSPVYAEVQGTMTSDESFHAIKNYTGACQATFDMSGELLKGPGELPVSW